MKNSTSITFVALILILSILACTTTINGNGGGGSVRGSGVAGSEDRSVGNVTGVELATPGTLDISQGSSELFRIEADDNLLQYIQTDVERGDAGHQNSARDFTCSPSGRSNTTSPSPSELPCHFFKRGYFGERSQVGCISR